jgi:hypothetical protein
MEDVTLTLGEKLLMIEGLFVHDSGDSGKRKVEPESMDRMMFPSLPSG